MAETETTPTTFKATSYSAKGTKGKEVKLPDTLFDGVVNMPVMHQAVKAFLANQRQGTAATKTRGFVVGGNQKPWKQKGTGRARAGSTRSPVFVGGGTVFGPTPRDYTQKVPRAVRALARKSALNARARENAIYIIDSFELDKPKTTAIIDLLQKLEIANKKVLILTDGVKQNVFLSARNLQRTFVLPFSDASTFPILWSDVVLIESGALNSKEGDK
jgi:large subunit ribosomal protein L4